MTDTAMREIVDQMRVAPSMKDKTALAGLVRRPVEADGLVRACENCIYFLSRSGWCDLPELDIPVDPEWYCLLWRV